MRGEWRGQGAGSGCVTAGGAAGREIKIRPETGVYSLVRERRKGRTVGGD